MFASIKFFVGQTINLDTILQNLITFRYRKVGSVFQEGDFAQRGGIIDLFPVQFDSPIRLDLDNECIRAIYSFNLTTGRSIWQHKIVIILPNRKALPETPFTSDFPLQNFVDIEKGDYVVHHTHGIGKYLGFAEMEVKQEKRTHLVIEYAGGDKLYVPQHDLHLVQKYISFTKKPPRLFKLGSREWERVRRHIQKRIQRLAAELLHMQALRLSLQGFNFSSDTEWQKAFEETFPFEETPDQIKATQEVKKDMESPHPMDRLICGDVGYGKTEVALRAAFKAVMDNKQVAVLVPTTILAEQHYYNFTQRLKDFPVKVAMLSRFKSKKEQEEIVAVLKTGRIDVVIGTHRLLSDDIGFKDLGLIVIDEEQRFGVRAKEKLKHWRVLVDILVLTATPIPRTLYMSLSGAKDMSVIATAPTNRLSVETHIVEFDEDLIREVIERELNRQGQIYFLHNRIQDIDQVARILKRLIPGVPVGVAHGQMPPRQLEEIMLKFLKGEMQVLVCTNIIESGIDIPNANTLIINHADRFGLADLHQLRGRVGRFKHQAYAYFIVPSKKHLSTTALNRLRALEKFSALGSGFQIAFEDLQIRGGGNLLGEEQSGYIATIGFDLYCRLLKESIGYLKNTVKSNS